MTFQVDSPGTVLISTLLDILALDILGLDILGLDILGLDILGRFRGANVSGAWHTVNQSIINVRARAQSGRLYCARRFNFHTFPKFLCDCDATIPSQKSSQGRRGTWTR